MRALFCAQARYDALIVDQVSAAIPFLKYLARSKVLFYCHFPDMLLAQRRSWVKRLYRWVAVPCVRGPLRNSATCEG